MSQALVGAASFLFIAERHTLSYALSLPGFVTSSLPDSSGRYAVIRTYVKRTYVRSSHGHEEEATTADDRTARRGDNRLQVGDGQEDVMAARR